MLAEIATLETRERELSTPGVLRGLIEPGADVAHRWADKPMSTRREIARLLLTPRLIANYDYDPPPGEDATAHQPTNCASAPPQPASPRNSNTAPIRVLPERSSDVMSLLSLGVQLV